MLLARILLLPLVIVLASCASRHAPTSGSAAPEQREILVREMIYDDKGLPLPGPVLAERPSRPGDHFTVLVRSNGQLVEGCDVAVAGGRADFRKPLEAVYEWTGKGFEVGLQVTSVLGRGLQGGVYSGSDALAALAIVFTPVAIGGVTGFVIGIGDGVVQTAVELRKFALDADEQVLTCTVYDYDQRGRMRQSRMLSPDRKQELVRTTFDYEGSGKEPARTTVESFVEGRKRNIR